MKRKFTLLAAALMLLAFITPPLRAVGQRTTITDYTQIVSGKTYYIGATISTGTDYYFSAAHNFAGTSITGIGQTDINNASTFTFTGSGDQWTIQFDNGFYLSLPSTDANGKVNVQAASATWTASNQNGLIRLEINDHYLQKNTSANTTFGSYKKTSNQKNIWLMEVPAAEPTCTASPTAWDFGSVQAGQTASKTFTLTTANLTEDISLLVYDDAAFTVSPTSIASTATSTDVTITFHPTLVQEWTDYLIISSDDFDDVELIELTGEGLCNAPTNALAYTTPVNLTLTGSSADYTLAPTSGTGNNGTITYSLISGDANHCILINNEFSADAIGTYVVRATQALNGTTCGGTFDITINVTGTDPVCAIDPVAYEFGTVITGSTQSATFTVTTANLTGALTVAIDNTDKGFSVSPTTIPQNATSTTVTVTYAPTLAHAEVYASLSITGGGLASATEAVITGAATDGYTVTFDAGTGSCTATEMTGLLPNQEITLPLSSTVTAPEGWTFVGWCATEVSTATTTQPTLLTDSYTVTGNATIYAVYSKTEAVETSFVFKDIAAANSWTNGTAYTTVEISPITLTANGGGNNGKYYTSDDTWRMYNGGSVSITTTTGSVTSVTSNPSKTFTISGGSASLSLTSQVNFKSITVNSSSTTYHTSPIGKVATPTIEVAGVSTGAANTYYETATVTLNCTTAEAAIYYTTDGNEPTTSSTLYEGPFAVTTTSTIRAIAVKASYDNSGITSPVTITIVQPNVAEFINGVYSSLSSQSEFNEWNKYSVIGDQAWAWSSSAARMSGYVSSVNYDNEDWLITPKMLVENGKLVMTFQCAGAYGNEDMLVAKYSTDYPGYGNPADYTWTTVTTDPTLPYNGTTSSFSDISCVVSGLANNTNVCFAIIYTSSTTKAGTALVKTFTAKQCYNLTLSADNGTLTSDPSGLIAVGTEVTLTPTPESGYRFGSWTAPASVTINAENKFTMPAENVTITATFEAIIPYTVTLGDYGNELTEASVGAGVTLPSRGNIGFYNFAGWSETNVATETTTAPTIIAAGQYYPTNNITLYPVYTRTVTSISNVVDLLNRDLTGVTSGSSSYTDWSDKTSNSTAVYKGQSAGGNDAIQLRTKNSTEGIVTTNSGGKAKKVVITWESHTNDGRTVDVYGKNTAYSSATNLYDNETQGTLLGSIVYGTSTELTISGDYDYIGLRSNDGALYLSEVKITWTSGGTTIYYNSGYYMPISKWTSTTSGDGWYLIAAPVGTEGVSDIGNLTNNTYDLYRFNQAAANEWENYKQHNFGLEEGRGYLYANSANNKLIFFDQSQSTTNSKEVTLTYSEANEDINMHGWNLIGNPFSRTATINKSGFYRMNGDHNEIIVAEDANIDPMEGIFVKATANNEVVTFTKTDSKGAASNNNLVIDLNAEKGNVIDRAIVRFDEGEALPKFQIKDNSTKLCIAQDGKEYAIVNAEAQDEMPVNFRANENGQYTLTVNAENVEMNYLHLIDNMTGMDVDLLQTPSYTFNATTTDYESRFRLVFAANNEDGASTGSASFAFYSNGNWVINNVGEATLQVVDITGRILSSETVNGSVSTTINATPGVYMIRLVNGESVKVQKIVVR